MFQLNSHAKKKVDLPLKSNNYHLSIILLHIYSQYITPNCPELFADGKFIHLPSVFMFALTINTVIKFGNKIF